MPVQAAHLTVSQVQGDQPGGLLLVLQHCQPCMLNSCCQTLQWSPWQQIFEHEPTLHMPMSCPQSMSAQMFFGADQASIHPSQLVLVLSAELLKPTGC